MLDSGPDRARGWRAIALGMTLVGSSVVACAQTPSGDDTGSAAESSSSGGPDSGPTEVDEALQAEVDAAVVDGLDGGVIALLVRDGVVAQAVAGTKNATGEALSADSRFNIGSVSKVYTAAMIHQLAEEGALELGAALSTYLPDTDYGPAVTLESLLSHRSGVPDYAANPAYLQEALLDPDRVFTTDELLEYSTFEEATPAGDGFSYSNTGYLFLGLVIEVVTGDTLDAALQARIVEPLGLVSTGYVDPPDFPDGLPSGWLDPTDFGLPAGTQLPVMPVSSALSGCRADCGIITTAPELRAFFEALFDGTLISAEALAEMTRSRDPAETSDGWGRGLQLYAPVHSPVPEYGHGGGGTGYTSLVTIRPDSGDITILFANNDAFELEGLLGAYAPAVLASW